MKFRVVIRKEGGDETRNIEAASRLDVYKTVEQEGGKVRSLEEGSDALLPRWLTASIGAPVRRQEVIMLAKNLAAMLGAGLSLARALSVAERQAGNPRLRTVIAAVEESVRGGSSFHDALAPHAHIFPTLFIAMVRSGEESGSLANALAVVATQMEHTEELTRKVRGALIYPAIVLAAVVVVSVLMMVYVVPTLVNTFISLKVELPLSTRIIIAISNFMVANTALVIVLIGLFVCLCALLMHARRAKNVVVAVALHLPLVGELIMETYAARTARSLASLLAAGVPVLEALAITRDVVGIPLYARVIAEAQENVKRGLPMSTAFVAHPALYPILMSDMAAVGEETGKTAELLAQAATFYETDVEDRTKDLSTIVEPVMMLVIGAAVGVFAISMIAPIYSLSTAF